MHATGPGILTDNDIIVVVTVVTAREAEVRHVIGVIIRNQLRLLPVPALADDDGDDNSEDDDNGQCDGKGDEGHQVLGRRQDVRLALVAEVVGWTMAEEDGWRRLARRTVLTRTTGARFDDYNTRS